MALIAMSVPLHLTHLKCTVEYNVMKRFIGFMQLKMKVIAYKPTTYLFNRFKGSFHITCNAVELC